MAGQRDSSIVEAEIELVLLHESVSYVGKWYETVTVGRWIGPAHRASSEMQVSSGTPCGLGGLTRKQ